MPLLALLAFLAFISLGLPDGLLGVSWPSMRLTFGVPLDALGTLVAFQTLGYLTSSSLSGRILRVLPIGGVLALSTLGAALALLGFALTTHWPVLLACGSSPAWPAAPSTRVSTPTAPATSAPAS
jgi:hypothetical protein